MTFVKTSRRSGVNGGSGLVDTQDEGYLFQRSIFSGGEWQTLTSFVRDFSNPIPPSCPDAGHSPVGYVDRISGDPTDVLYAEWRGFWRFDLHGIDLANVFAASLSWDIREIVAWAGYANETLDLVVEAGYNVTGAALESSDWARSFPYLLATFQKPSWLAEGTKTIPFRNLQVLRDGAGGSPRFDVRVKLANYVASQTGIRVDFSSGDNIKTIHPQLEITTVSEGIASVRKIPARLVSALRTGRIRRINAREVAVGTLARTARVRRIGPLVARIAKTERTMRLVDRGISS